MKTRLIKYYKGSKKGREKTEVKQCTVCIQCVVMSAKSLTFFCALCLIINITNWNLLEASN